MPEWPQLPKITQNLSFILRQPLTVFDRQRLTVVVNGCHCQTKTATVANSFSELCPVTRKFMGQTKIRTMKEANRMTNGLDLS